MQQQDILKIKRLIEVSYLLSPSEKEEWLALAEIMNDKQLWELRSILESAISNQQSAIKMGVPPLTHIINLPKAGAAVFPKQVAGSKYQVSSIEQAEKQAKGQNKTGFWQKIKDVLAEKELPAGHKELVEELQLPEHVETLENLNAGRSQAEEYEKSPVSIPKAPALPRAVPKQEQIAGKARPLAPVRAPKPEIPKKQPAPEKLSSEEMTIGTLKVANLVMTKGETGFSAPVDAPALFASPATEKAERAEKEGERQTAEDDLFVPGLKDAEILVDAKLRKTEPRDSLGTDASSLADSVRRYSESLKQPQKHYEHIDIHTLEQVGELGVKALSKDILPPLKNLTDVLGYHKLAMALEKSPLFQSYINTGLAALGGKYDLDSGEYREKTLEKYLTKEEFERVVDVLRAIKA